MKSALYFARTSKKLPIINTASDPTVIRFRATVLLPPSLRGFHFVDILERCRVRLTGKQWFAIIIMIVIIPSLSPYFFSSFPLVLESSNTRPRTALSGILFWRYGHIAPRIHEERGASLPPFPYPNRPFPRFPILSNAFLYVHYEFVSTKTICRSTAFFDRFYPSRSESPWINFSIF